MSLSKKRILMVLTSHDQLGQSDHKTGFWLEEFAAPYYVFADAGVEVVLASPKGGKPPMDPASGQENAQTEATRRFSEDLIVQQALAHTQRLQSLDADDFDGVFYPGGHGPLWDLVDDPNSIAIIEQSLEKGSPVAAVCHASAVLLNAKAHGEWLLKDKEVTGFSNAEEEAVGLDEIVPFLLESELRARGGRYKSAELWQEFVVQDGLLVTGQNPASSKLAAEKQLELLA